jgi:hypothetical protein
MRCVSVTRFDRRRGACNVEGLRDLQALNIQEIQGKLCLLNRESLNKAIKRIQS